MKIFVFTIFLIAFGVNLINAKYPSFLKKCKFEDSECIKSVTQTILSSHGSDKIPEFNVNAFDPIYVKHISSDDISKETRDVLNLDLKLDELYLSGFKNSKVIKTEFRRKDDKIKMNLQFQLDKLVLKAKDEVSGRLINVLPLEGKGNVVLTTEKPFFIIKINGHVRNDFMVIEKLTSKYNLTGFNADFDSLFDGDKVLTETVNHFINSNWKELFDVLSPALFELHAVAFSEFLSKMFSSVKFSELFL